MVNPNVDVERLILIVQNHYEIFDPRDPKHRDREHMGRIWKGIANELNNTESLSKWHNLRSNYAREKRKLKPNSTDGAAKTNVHIKWPYYDAMRFLDGFMRPNESQANETETFDIAQFTTNDAGDLVSFKSAAASSPTSSKSLKKRQSQSINVDKIDALYMKHLEKLINNNNDPDLLYLKSLLPMMKQLTTLKSLEFKGEVITLLKNKLQSQENYTNSNPAGPGPGPAEYTTAYL
ncbi:hypothetical protein LSTR_LSTR002636 [Laodelphax striatellus]|uniref:MADF domain-containing protein n=1 Tax=Laodelphax striatellus TaxID=195883 RepID=A0A482XLR9_LAOST|nr:hypothetical protein LSTR_LSTR002636 [Laodelphax striatellus]